MNAAYEGVDVNSWRSVKEHFMIRYRGKTETTTFCHQIPKLVQDKTETVSDFAERCIMEMQEFVDAMPNPADRFNTAAYLALPAMDKTQARKARASNNDRLSLQRMLSHGSDLSHQDDAYAEVSSHAQ